MKADNPGWTGDAGFRVFRLAEEKLAWRNDIRTEADLLSMLDEIIADTESDKADTHLVWREALKAGYRLDALITEPGPGIYRAEQDGRVTWIALLRDREIPEDAPMKLGGPLRLKLLAAGATRRVNALDDPAVGVSRAAARDLEEIELRDIATEDLINTFIEHQGSGRQIVWWWVTASAVAISHLRV